MKKGLSLIIDSITDLDETVVKLLDYAGDCRKMLFSGEIGAGKTTFIQHFCKYFEVQEKVLSPTFSLVNEYTYFDKKTQLEAFIHHMDLYRLKSEQEAIDIGIEDYLFGESYCLIEWPELIEGLLPDEVIKINIEIVEDSKRKIIFL